MTKKKRIEDGPLKCPECEGDAEPMMINVSGLGISGWPCSLRRTSGN